MSESDTQDMMAVHQHTGPDLTNCCAVELRWALAGRSDGERLGEGAVITLSHIDTAPTLSLAHGP